ncbi:hypothetical protein D9611_009136 [Ephemerocybe angulata]|uniref:FAD-binding PCMH-type domain-containing protein n=1 Tax=Ephemerocybe angulata TaxID=980116 RepID=A0A8H5CDI4_9AGAR|nr:hypothetical protein D9611_009136 [Tulosesus angulatus]
MTKATTLEKSPTSIMKSLKALLPLLFLSQTVISNSNSCKCLYGQSCWPSSDAFNALASKLSQPLIRPLPPASPCYSLIPEDAPVCSEAQANAHNGTWLSGVPGAYQNTNFEAYIFPNNTVSACYFNTTLGGTCGQGSVPPLGVDARSPEDIQAAVNFAREHNLKLVVKNTGHDYLGRSAARDAFMIWTHHMKSIDFHDDFAPEGAPDTEKHEAVTLGAGVQWSEAYAAAAAQNKYVVGGISDTGSVGAAGGWILGGGHSAFSGKFGLGVDNVLQFTLVNAKGEHVTANAHTNPTLFWALRGGGGGTFGITTTVTYRTHPIVPLTLALASVNFTSPDAAQRGITEYIHTHVTLSDKQWGGYSFLTNSTLFFGYFAPNVSLPDANATITPLFDVLKEVGEEGILTELIPVESFYALLNLQVPNPAGPQVGNKVELSSRFLSRDTALNRAEETARTLLSLDFVAINYVAGGAVLQVDPESAGLNPAWRNALAQVYIAENWQDGDSADTIHAAQQRLRDNTAILDRISTDSAAYLNEASLHEVDFKKAFWGPHYNRLKKIKNSVDPTGLFVVPRGVGSDDWDEELVCRV